MAVSPDGESLYSCKLSSRGIERGDRSSIRRRRWRDALAQEPGGGRRGRPSLSEVAVSPDGKSVYVTNDAAVNPSVSQYDVGAGGTLSPQGPATVGTEVWADRRSP